jgi:hypothetical protein
MALMAISSIFASCSSTKAVPAETTRETRYERTMLKSLCDQEVDEVVGLEVGNLSRRLLFEQELVVRARL